jgi:hypothetical protein
MINFRGSHYPKDAILYAVYFYVRYGESYRDLEEILEERGSMLTIQCSIAGDPVFADDCRENQPGKTN